MTFKGIAGRIEPLVWSWRRARVARKERLAPGRKLFDWKTVAYGRTDAINFLIRENGYRRYLEIGCQNDVNFKSVSAPVKVGVDPASGGTHRMTSDGFFAQNRDTFDIVFIDGLHTYEQVRKDLYHSLACLAPGGAVVFHDMLPASWEQERVPRLTRTWNGTGWKIAYELKRLFGDAFGIIMADQGLGVAFAGAEAPAALPDSVFQSVRAKGYGDFLKDYESFNLIPAADAERFLRARSASRLQPPSRLIS